MRFFGRSIVDALSKSLPGNIQQRLINYTLKYLLGSYFKQEFSQENLDVQILDGVVALTDIELRADVINAKLTAIGYELESGSIERLEISIPWSNVLSGKVSVLVQGLRLNVTARSGEHTLDATVSQLDRDLSVSVADVAESFLVEESAIELGVNEDLPEPALVQNVLDTILSGLSVEATRISIQLQASASSDLVRLSVQSASCKPALDGHTRSCHVRSVDVYLSSVPEQLATLSNDTSSHSASSRSTSTSSYHDAELMQSTIFGTEQSRSIFMSAMAYQTDAAHSVAIEDEHLASNLGRHVLRSSGFDGLINPSVNDGLKLDISWDNFEITAGRSELLALMQLHKDFTTKRKPRSDQAQQQERATLSWISRFTEIKLQIDLYHNLELDEEIFRSSTFLECRLGQLSFSVLASEGLEVNIASLRLQLGDTRLRGLSTPFANLRWDLESIIKGTLSPMESELDVQESATFLEHLQDLFLVGAQISSTSFVSEQSESASTSTDLSISIDCPSINIQWRTDAHSSLEPSLILVVQKPMLQWSSTTVRTRASLTFTSLIASLDDHRLFELRSLETPNIVDFTSNKTKTSHTTLEFIKYAELFDHLERDRKTEISTLKALKQKSKDSASYIVRASLGQLNSLLDVCKIRCVMEFLQRFTPAKSKLKSPILPTTRNVSHDRTTMILIEVGEITCHLDCYGDTFTYSFFRTNLFLVNRLKNILAVSLDIRNAELSTTNNAGKATRLAHSCLHLHESSERSIPLITMRLRHNLAGHRAGTTMIRLGLAEAQLEYFPDMPWLDSLQRLVQDVQRPSESRRASHSPHSLVVDFAVDLTDVAIGLNPYAGKSKGLLFMRKSLLQAKTNLWQLPQSISIHAGVIELFLMDNIDGGQNDKSDSTRIRKDHVTSNLLKLGFVKVVNLETLEITLRTHKLSNSDPLFALDVVGAILTITACADSLATLTSLISLLRIPLVISDELKYKLGLTDQGEIPLDVFADIDLNAFSPLNVLEVADKPAMLEAVQSVSRTKTNNSENDASRDAARTPPLVINVNGQNISADSDASSKLLDDYFLSQSIVLHENAGSGVTEIVSSGPRFKLRAQKCFVVCNLHDGYDWEHTRGRIAEAIELAIAKAQKTQYSVPNDQDVQDREDFMDEESMIPSDEYGDVLFNSIYISLPTGSKAEDVTQAINRELAQVDTSDTTTQTTVTRSPVKQVAHEQEGLLQLGRSKAHKVRVELSNIDTNFVLFNAAEGEVLSELGIKVRDLEIMDNVSTSTWRKFMTYHRGAGPRDDTSSMVQLNITSVKPIAGMAAAELAISMVVSPLRLHVDQDTLEFLTRFFEFKDIEASPQELLPAEEIYIQRFEVQAIPVRIDYKPKRVDYKSLRSGFTTEFKNIFILEDSNMLLKHVVLYGVSGFSRIAQHLNEIWLNHIKSSQLSSVLAGVSPIRSLASLSGGLKSLVTMPLKDYRRDGRIGPGLKRGLDTFLRNTSSEAVRLGAKLAIGTQGLLESAEKSFSNRENTSHQTVNTHAISKYADQPENLTQGLAQALGGMSRNVSLAKNAIASMPRDLEDETDARGAVRVAAKSIPIAVLRPLIGTTEMISKTLLGLKNTIDPEQRHMNKDKYKSSE